MDVPDADSPPLPKGRPASGAVARAGCVVALGLALLPTIYLGSFALVIIDDQMRWGFWGALDDRIEALLRVFYWPLIWVYLKILGIE